MPHWRKENSRLGTQRGDRQEGDGESGVWWEAVKGGCGGTEREDDFEVNSKSDRKPLQGHRADINQITE